MWPFRRQRKSTSSAPWPLSMRLVRLSDQDDLTLADACEGVAIFGSTGSGKTTGSGQCFATSYLRAGMGGLVLCAKPDDVSMWEQYCRRTGRLEDLVVFAPDQPWRFNFLDHEWQRPGAAGSQTENVVHLFSEALQVMDRQSRSGGKENDTYWRNTHLQQLRNAVDTVSLARGRVTIPDLYQFIISLPMSPAQVNDPDWQGRSFAFQCLREADARQKSAVQRSDFALCSDYALIEAPSLSEKTRSIITSVFTSLADVFLRGVLRELFCTTTNITPEATRNEGKIIVMGLDAKTFGRVGQVAQTVMKYAFMRSIERQATTDATRPVFLWIDEAQLFTTDFDFLFQTTARSARVCTVLLSQNLPTWYATLGAGEEGEAAVNSLMANLSTKVLHANSCPITNEWASSMIGRSSRFLMNGSTTPRSPESYSPLWGWPEPQVTGGMTETLDFEIEPRRFSELRKGGVANRGQVDAIVFQNGRRFRQSGKTWLPVTFQQQFG